MEAEGTGLNVYSEIAAFELRQTAVSEINGQEIQEQDWKVKETAGSDVGRQHHSRGSELPS